MRHVPRLFVSEALAEGAQLVLAGEAAHHLLNVLRIRPGAPLILFNGGGGEFEASVAQLGKRDLTVRVGRRQPAQRESPLAITLAQAVSRGERMDYAIQKAMELGVAAIQPLATEHSLRLDGERAGKKLAHWQAVAQSAAEQSGRERLPPVLPLLPLAEWLPRAGDGLKLALHPAGAPLKSLQRSPGLTLLVGPEGGLSEQDIRHCAAAGFQTLSLGPRILRTESAGAAALAAIQTLWGDLG